MDEQKEIQKLLQLLVNVNRERAAEIVGLHMVINALVLSHPNRTAFLECLDTTHQKWLADALHKNWSERELELASSAALSFLGQ